MYFVNIWFCWLFYFGDNKYMSICFLVFYFYYWVCLYRKWIFYYKVCMLYFFYDIYFVYSYLIKEKCVIKYLKVWILIENFKFFIRYFVYIDMVYKGYFFCYILFWWSVDMFLRWCYIVMDKYICVDRFLLCYCIGYICKIVYSL